ncbi:hypothetical protein SAMN05443287_10474 [Micromonospora phaseoli]|uniref:IrrE N-terminal-like domain-containing protein n=1 Tax=Micromonospora phaseoli TaxID=1144548 RepID=A0A1H6Y616_9ACTN|nr:hypothetical protein [Micromonospora phaseoli]PZW00047.1 hypothetical protein CLV64_10373 [Micromonospora phaseoli]GIJ80411.1 hypothetical protein Xph01_48430 [Micromonospora phaseoli]SEJ36691.1 hypothetical protein SAMN05443287_10474 [Micromonospora phaseoli]
MYDRDLRRFCGEQVRRLEREVGLPDPFVLTTLVRRISQWRGRPIHLLPYDHVAGAMCGLWMALPDADVIGYARTTPLLEEHTVLHELGHMLCDHKGSGNLGTDLGALLAPDLDPALVSRFLGRGSYSDRDEQEAELIATLIMRKVTDKRPRPAAPASQELGAELDRLLSTFEG